MTREVEAFWQKSLQDLKTADLLINKDSDAAVSRAYYAAFHAVSALFLLEGKEYFRHSAIMAAVHRDLVNTGRWPARLGAIYSSLGETRNVADYGRVRPVEVDEAREAVDGATIIVEAVHALHPQVFALS